MTVNVTREEVAEAIQQKPRTSHEVAEWLGCSLKSAQHHLYRLRDENRARKLRDGRWAAGTACASLVALQVEADELQRSIDECTSRLRRVKMAMLALEGGK